MTRMTGGRALVEMLQRHGVDTLFVLPGVQNDGLFVALHDFGGDIRRKKMNCHAGIIALDRSAA